MQVLPISENGLLVVIRALDFALPAEAARGIELFWDCKCPSQQVQQAFFDKLCSEAAIPTVVDQLQAHHELAAQSSGIYILLVQRLSSGQICCKSLCPVLWLSPILHCTSYACGPRYQVYLNKAPNQKHLYNTDVSRSLILS